MTTPKGTTRDRDYVAGGAGFVKDTSEKVIDDALAAADRERELVSTPPADVPRETSAGDGLPAELVVEMDSFTIGEMDKVGEWMRATEHGRLTIMAWVVARRHGFTGTPDEISSLPATRIRVVRGDTGSVPLESA